MITRARVALIGGIVLGCAACSSSNSVSTATPVAPAVSPISTVTFDTTTIAWTRDGVTASMRVEVASTADQSQRGLGYRDSLPEDAGMLFDLHETRVPGFWMKGMRFPLDMVWIGEDGRVAAVTENVPPQPGVADEGLGFTSPPVPVRYALELNAGAARRLGIVAGTQLAFDLPARRAQ